MSHRFPNPSGRPVARLASAALLLLATTGCMYSLTGGGLPGHINTIAVLPFENTTSQPLLETDIEQVMQRVLPGNLGVNLAAEDVADAVIRGRIISYEEVATSVRPTGEDQQVPVVQRQIRIAYEAEIYDVLEDRPLWRARSQSVIGNFQPDSETPLEGRSRAIDELIKKVIEGAQSQW